MASPFRVEGELARRIIVNLSIFEGQRDKGWIIEQNFWEAPMRGTDSEDGIHVNSPFNPEWNVKPRKLTS